VFIINPNDYAAADDAGEVVAVIHSHPDLPAEPSQADRTACEASALPWFIVSLPGLSWADLYPSGYKSPLVGRQWAHGVQDCYSLVRDWYAQEMGLQLPDFYREDEWWLKGQNLYLDNFEACGFVEVPFSEIQPGDALLMKIFSPVPCHAAIYLGDEMILHHMHGKLSCRERLTGPYLSRVSNVVRYNSPL
jgi:cell wall-associated NlpC family hydrolase